MDHIVIGLKDTTVLKTLFEARYHPKIVGLLFFYTVKFPDYPTIITCGYRAGDPGVHGTDPCRGLDLRTHQGKGIIVIPKPEEVAHAINQVFTYDLSRPEKVCALYHDVGKGRHLHLQVHDNTVCNEGWPKWITQV